MSERTTVIGIIRSSKRLKGKLSVLEVLRGYSAYEIAVQQGFTGTLDQWLESLAIRNTAESAAHAETAQQSAEAAGQSAQAARAAGETAASAATAARSWAAGGTGTRAGEDTDNARYWCLHMQEWAAPAGYGWGDTVARTVTDIDAITVSGIYTIASLTIDGVYFTTPKILHIQRAPNRYTQEIIPAYGNQGEATSSCRVIRHKITNANWSSWEWENPPMEVGVEYRTTQRYQGKAVYTKLVSFGSLGNNAETYLYLSDPIPASGNILEVAGKAHNPETSVTLMIPSPTVFGDIAMRANKNYIYVKPGFDATKFVAHFVMKYTRD